MNITADFINTNTDFNTLIEKLRKGQSFHKELLDQ